MEAPENWTIPVSDAVAFSILQFIRCDVICIAVLKHDRVVSPLSPSLPLNKHVIAKGTPNPCRRRVSAPFSSRLQLKVLVTLATFHNRLWSVDQKIFDKTGVVPELCAANGTLATLPIVERISSFSAKQAAAPVVPFVFLISAFSAL